MMRLPKILAVVPVLLVVLFSSLLSGCVSSKQTLEELNRMNFEELDKALAEVDPYAVKDADGQFAIDTKSVLRAGINENTLDLSKELVEYHNRLRISEIDEDSEEAKAILAKLPLAQMYEAKKTDSLKHFLATDATEPQAEAPVAIKEELEQMNFSSLVQKQRALEPYMAVDYKTSIVAFDADKAREDGNEESIIALAKEMMAYQNLMMIKMRESGISDITKVDVSVEPFPLAKMFQERATKQLDEAKVDEPLADEIPVSENN